MNNTNCNDNLCSISKCDIFDFMAKYVGLTVIHPGGLNTTQRLLNLLNITENTKVIDIVCGKGSTAFYLGNKNNCNVLGNDISEESIEEAEYFNKKRGFEKKITFQLGNAMDLLFSDSEFDLAI
ncbi:methyltransferase domain-containing protein [Bacteroidota bacterium]